MSNALLDTFLKDDDALARNWKKNENRRKLAQALVLTRKHAGMTQAELAQATGWTQPTVSRIESATGPMPDTETIEKYVEGCGCHFRLVFTEMPPKLRPRPQDGFRVECSF